MIALQRIIFNILNVCTVPRIMFRAPHIMFEAPHIMFEARHIMFEAPHIMIKAPHIMFEALPIMFEAPNIMLDAPHIIFEAPQIMFKTPHIMFKAPHIIFEPPHIMIKSPNEMTFDHLRQLWLSIGDDSEHYFIVKPFPGATITDMEDFVKPLTRRTPDKMVLHVGTNDLMNGTPKVIADSVVNLVAQVKEDSPNTAIGVSAILVRSDNNDLAVKALQVNVILNEYCLRNNIPFLNNTNIDTTHLNYKGLHLNKQGTSVLQQNLSVFVNNID